MLDGIRQAVAAAANDVAMMIWRNRPIDYAAAFAIGMQYAKSNGIAVNSPVLKRTLCNYCFYFIGDGKDVPYVVISARSGTVLRHFKGYTA
jgi:hypothetical protein